MRWLDAVAVAAVVVDELGSGFMCVLFFSESSRGLLKNCGRNCNCSKNLTF